MMWIVLDNIHYFMLSGTDIEFKEKLFQPTNFQPLPGRAVGPGPT